MIGQTLWDMPREEYNKLGEADECGCEACEAIIPNYRFPLLITDAEIEQAIQADDAEQEQLEQEKLANIDWFGIIRSFG